MIKWYCFHNRVVNTPQYKRRHAGYIPAMLNYGDAFNSTSSPEDFIQRLTVVGVELKTLLLESGRGAKAYFVYGLSHDMIVQFKTPRDAFEAAEKAFASAYPELYLQAVLNEGGKSRD